jgi:hypothetical protein
MVGSTHNALSRAVIVKSLFIPESLGPWPRLNMNTRGRAIGLNCFIGRMPMRLSRGRGGFFLCFLFDAGGLPVFFF